MKCKYIKAKYGDRVGISKVLTDSKTKKQVVSASLDDVRRLIVTKQHLSGNIVRRSTVKDIISTVRDLAYVQWDPVSIVAPSHQIALWSRFGNFQTKDIDNLLWVEKKAFEYWTPIASIVLSEDYPIYYSLMRRYPESLSNSWGAQRDSARKFLTDHSELRARMRGELKKGPLQSNQFSDYFKSRTNGDAWTPSSNVTRMLLNMHMSGEVMVVDHQGNQNVWGLSEDFLPDWIDKTELSEEDLEREMAQRAIKALGVATPPEINYYFVRGRYQMLKKILTQLQEESVIHRVNVEGLDNRKEMYIHEQDVPILDSVGTDAWQPRMSLLSPFDNLIYSSNRTNRLFGFNYVREQFLPQEKRKFGTYVLPILWGNRLIGRIDPRIDRKSNKLVINSMHAEIDAPSTKDVVSKIGETIEQLAEFIGAGEVEYSTHSPALWRDYLH